MLHHKTPNHTKFGGDRLKNAGDIRDRKFVLPKKWAKVHLNFLVDATPYLRPPIMPNFIEIGQTSLEIGVGREKNFHTQTDRLTDTHTHTRHPDWLSRASQHARGAPKKPLSKVLKTFNFGASQVCRAAARWRPLWIRHCNLQR